MFTSLLTTKLYLPPLSRRVVPRPRLLRRLDEGLDLGCRLTLVSAPAGFGKTTLLSAWFRRVERPVAWLSLDEADNDPARFMAYLVAAIQTVDPGVGRSAGAALDTPGAPPLEPLLTRLTNEIAASPEPFILVLDDYHAIEAEPVHEIVAFLLDHLPPPAQGLHLVIATRADPPLPLARLRARGQLCELHEADLRFGPEEALAFLNEAMDLDLSFAQVAALEGRTEGWIAGLQLAALALRGTLDRQGRQAVPAFIDAFAGSHRYVLDYLTEEVLSRQPADRRAFLLHTAILDRLSGPLCDLVAAREDSQGLLEALEAANLFILPLDEERRWYRYHQLFADLLRHRLRRDEPGLEPMLHRRACDWHEQEGLIPEAVGHALAAGDDERAADLMEWAAWTVLARGEISALRGWLDRLPTEIMYARPQLGIFYAWTLALGGEPEKVEPYLGTVDLAQVQGEAAAVRAHAASIQEEIGRATSLAQRVFELLPEEKWFSRGFAAMIVGIAALDSGDPATAIRALSEDVRLGQAAGRSYLASISASMLGEALHMGGRLHEAAEALQEALRLASEQGARPAPFAGLAHVVLSRLLYEWDDLDGAEEHARRALELGKIGGLTDPVVGGTYQLARAHLARGEAEEAARLIQQAEEQAHRYEQNYLWARTSALRSRLRAVHGDRWLPSRLPRPNMAEPDSEALYLSELVDLARVRECIIEARAGEALTILERLLDQATAAGRVASRIEILVLQAIAFQLAGDESPALAALEQALSLGEPEGFVRTFADEGQPMVRLLRKVRTRGIALEYCRRLLAAGCGGTAAAAPVGQALIEPLTKRELEVLRLITAGLSNREIADRLVVALSTVKTHINHIYGKLAVRSRVQAAARARELDLL